MLYLHAYLAYPQNKFVWFYDGNVSYFALSHIPRFLVAFIIVIFATVYIVMLSCGHVFSRYSKYKLFKWTTHKYCIHFMNAHHAPLNNDISEQEEREQLVEDVNNETADDQLREPALDILIPVQPEDYNIPDPPSPSIQTRQMTTFVDIR